ncbi:endolytic transglycosylase MltG [bacterium]|nr:MAG: endolytic transglycosylase MltG [bacterium]
MQMEIKSYWPLNKNETLVFSSLFVISLLIVSSVRWFRLENPYAVTVSANTSVFIQEKKSIEQFAKQLQELGLVRNTKSFVWTAKLEGFRQVQAGHYVLKRGNYKVGDMISKPGLGHQDPIRLTILPGQSIEKLILEISDSFRFSEQEFSDFVHSEIKLAELGLTPENVISRLTPETYSMFWTYSPKQVIQETQSLAMKTIESKEGSIPQNLSSDEVLTLASIVQWEAGNDEEKPMIAGLYLNRLRKKWPLQADPTVNFALGERRRLTYADYQINHPYNTYKYRGLPPGPITNPDVKSIDAVLNPVVHRYMYMVATPEGKHDFSITYEEHQQKSARWVKWLRQQYRIKKMNEAK